MCFLNVVIQWLEDQPTLIVDLTLNLRKLQLLAGSLAGTVPDNYICVISGNPLKVSSLELYQFILNYITLGKLLASVFFVS